jgi:hypothetical protein
MGLVPGIRTGGVFPVCKIDRGVKLTTEHHLVPRLRIKAVHSLLCVRLGLMEEGRRVPGRWLWNDIARRKWIWCMLVSASRYVGPWLSGTAHNGHRSPWYYGTVIRPQLEGWVDTSRKYSVLYDGIFNPTLIRKIDCRARTDSVGLQVLKSDCSTFILEGVLGRHYVSPLLPNTSESSLEAPLN